MSEQFRELLKKVGSGQHTKKDLTRTEAAIAARLMLTGTATPAQIGAFLIAHRIKRPTGLELAGMLDAYDEFGQKLAALPPNHPIPLIFGIPYDGRTRTAPILPLTALLLSTAGVPVILHGAAVMPTKYGLPLLEIFQALGLDFRDLSLTQRQDLLSNHNFTFYYTPQHFPQTQILTDYRDQIGKRPPLATLDMIWSPYLGQARFVIGYVHPPTETMIREALEARGENDFTLIKGLEGSCDLRLSQTNIISTPDPGSARGMRYLKLNSHEYGFAGKEVALVSPKHYFQELQALLNNDPSELRQALLWNGGFYIWHCGICPNLIEGIKEAELLLESGKIQQKWQALKAAIAK